MRNSTISKALALIACSMLGFSAIAVQAQNAIDWNKDGLDDIVTGAGAGNAPRVRIFNIRDQSEIISLLPYSTSFLGGVNVAGSTLDSDNIAQPF